MKRYILLSYIFAVALALISLGSARPIKGVTKVFPDDSPVSIVERQAGYSLWAPGSNDLPLITDLIQGNSDSCAYISAMAIYALKNPQWIQSMLHEYFIPTTGGTIFEATLRANPRSPLINLCDTTMMTASAFDNIPGQPFLTISDARWPRVMFEAIKRRDNTNCEWVPLHTALEAISGVPETSISSIPLQDPALVNAVLNGAYLRAGLIGFEPSVVGTASFPLRAEHAYGIVSFDKAASAIELLDPATGVIDTLDFNALKASVKDISVAGFGPGMAVGYSRSLQPGAAGFFCSPELPEDFAAGVLDSNVAAMAEAGVDAFTIAEVAGFLAGTMSGTAAAAAAAPILAAAQKAAKEGKPPSEVAQDVGEEAVSLDAAYDPPITASEDLPLPQTTTDADDITGSYSMPTPTYTTLSFRGGVTVSAAPPTGTDTTARYAPIGINTAPPHHGGAIIYP